MNIKIENQIDDSKCVSCQLSFVMLKSHSVDKYLLDLSNMEKL